MKVNSSCEEGKKSNNYQKFSKKVFLKISTKEEKQNCPVYVKLNNKCSTTIFELEIFIDSAKFKHFTEYDHHRDLKGVVIKRL
jgi:hypothetical protein